MCHCLKAQYYSQLENLNLGVGGFLPQHGLKKGPVTDRRLPLDDGFKPFCIPASPNYKVALLGGNKLRRFMDILW